MLIPDYMIRELSPSMIKEYREECLNPASYDLTLSSVIRRVKDLPYEMDVVEIPSEHTYLYVIDDRGFQLKPFEFILAASNEIITLPQDLAARVEGKSSLGRIGLAVHITAGFIDPGFHGSITLEVVNLLGKHIRLRKNMRIAQIAFMPMFHPPEMGYEVKGHYQNTGLDGNPVESRYRMDT